MQTARHAWYRPGAKTIGLSASTDKAELYSAEVEVRQDISRLISDRRELRRARRSRKTRYRAPRFSNRVRSRHKGWLAPSVEHKVATHLACVGKIRQILPVTTIVFEEAKFDIQRLQNPEIAGIEYQNGPQRGFDNVRARGTSASSLVGARVAPSRSAHLTGLSFQRVSTAENCVSWNDAQPF